MSQLRLIDVSIAFGAHNLLDHANLELESGQRIGLIGRNGEGKSTLLRMLAGEILPDSGEIRMKPGLVVSMLDQTAEAEAGLTVFEAVCRGAGDVGRLLSTHENLSRQQHPDETNMNRLADLQDALNHNDGWNTRSQVMKTLGRLGLDADTPVDSLSGGWRRRVALAAALVSDPDILLLDEPTNHLDIETVRWLERQLLKFNGSIVFVTHDRTFLQNITTQIVELDRGKLVAWQGSYGDYLRRKAAALQQEERQNAEFDKKLAKEEAWIRQGIRARRTRNEGRVRALFKLRQQQSERRQKSSNAKLGLDKGQQSGKVVIEADNISYRIDGRPIIQSFSTRILRGDRIGLIGPNGVGKTTLLKLLLGDLEPDEGTLQRGSRLETTYFDQLRSPLDENSTVIDIIGQGREEISVNGKTRHVISYLGDFLFAPSRARSPVKALSGGERARVLLARLFSKPTNFLIMDEPTNDLDIETLELLEELLLEYQGTLLLVSHDRQFLDNVVTSTFCFRGNGLVEENSGGYSEWEKRLEKLERENLAHTKQPPSEPVGQKQPAPAIKRKKLSYNAQRELDQLPARIEQLETRQQKFTDAISRADFYSQPQEKVNQVLEDMKKIADELDQCYQRWSELEDQTA